MQLDGNLYYCHSYVILFSFYVYDYVKRDCNKDVTPTL